MSGWNGSLNAKKYDEYAKKFPMYRDTSRDLVRSANVKPGMTVVDLACGTGVTSQAVLEVLNGEGHLHSVDMAQAMLDVARQNVQHDNVSFHLSPAEDLDKVITEPVDRVVCNSAFWQLKPDETLGAVHKILKANGIFAFNLPNQFIRLEDADSYPDHRGKFFDYLRQIALSDFGIQVPPPPSPSDRRTPPTLEDLQNSLQRNNFSLIRQEIITYTQSGDGAAAFNTIPVMTEPVLPGVDYETRMAIYAKVSSQFKTENPMERRWLFVVATPVTKAG